MKVSTKGLLLATSSIVILVLLSPASPAGALATGTVQITGDRLEYIAATGTRNVVSLSTNSDDSGAIVVTDKSGVTAGPGCGQTTPTEARCSPVGVRSVLVSLGDRFDRLRVNVPVPAVLYGDGGNDEIFSEDASTRADGGTGDDLIGGGRSDDTLYGGAGDDDVGGSLGPDLLLGGPGDDQVYGGYGTDELRGEQGADLMLGGANDDRLSGGPNDDRVNGEHGDDHIAGDFGSDVLTGSNGDDQILSRDGQPDSVACGNDTDYVHADNLDTVTSNTCETVIVT
jgi:Ca2+-binding RTX toxin-like protein